MRDSTIGQRLAAGFGVVLGLMLVLVAVAYYGQHRQTQVEAHLVGVVMPRADAANDIGTAYLQQSAAARSFVYSGDEQYLAEYQNGVDRAKEALGRLDALPRTEDGDAIFAQIQPLASQYAASADRAISLRRQGQLSEAERVVSQEMIPTRERLIAKAEAFVALQFHLRDQAIAELERVRTETTVGSAVLALLMLLAGAVVAWSTARSIRNPTRRLVTATERLAAGDYDAALGLAGLAGKVAGGDGEPRNEVSRLAASFASMSHSLRAREGRLAARARLSSALASSLELRRLASEGLREIVEYGQFQLGVVYIHDEEGRFLRPAASYAIDRIAETVPLGEGIVGEAATSRRSVVVRDIPGDAPFAVDLGFDRLPPRAVVAVPLVCQDELVGVTLLGSLGDLTKDTLDFVEISAQQLAVSLQNAVAHARMEAMAEALREKNEQLAAQNEELQSQNEEIQAQSEEIQSQSEEIQSQNEELQAQNEEIQAQSASLAEQNVRVQVYADHVARLQELSVELSRHLLPEEVLPRVVGAASDLLGSSVASVLLLDTSGKFFTVGAAVGLDEAEQRSLRLGVEDSLAGRVIADENALFIEDLSRDQSLQVPVLAGGARMGAMIVAPMMRAGVPLGVVEVYFREPREFQPQDRELLSALASTAAVVIHNARLFDETTRQRQLLQNVIDSIPEAVHVVDGEGRLLTANDAARDLFDLEGASTLERWAAANGGAVDPSELGLWSATARAMRGKTVLGEEAAYSDERSERSGYVQLSAAPVFIPGQVGAVAVVTVAADISRLKELEQMKDDFISEASHELKTPLTAAKGFAQLLHRRMEATPGTESYRKMVYTIDGQIDRLVKLVDRLLDASRAQAGRLQPKMEPVDLSTLVRQQVQMAQVKTEKHTLVAETVGEIMGHWDRGYLEQVVANLLENAVQYSPNGGEIRVTLEGTEGVARLRVADHGIGMSPVTLTNLFRRHYRSEEAQRVRVEGMGLGLYLTQEIVVLHGGRIWAESEPGKGSVFTVELPVSGS